MVCLKLHDNVLFYFIAKKIIKMKNVNQKLNINDYLINFLFNFFFSYKDIQLWEMMAPITASFYSNIMTSHSGEETHTNTIIIAYTYHTEAHAHSDVTSKSQLAVFFFPFEMGVYWIDYPDHNVSPEPPHLSITVHTDHSYDISKYYILVINF